MRGRGFGQGYGGGFGRGFGRGSGGGFGFGFRGSSPPWPYVGLGRGGLPRCGYYAGGVVAPQVYNPVYAGVQTAGYAPYSPTMTREDELNRLRDQAEMINEQLNVIQSRMHDLGADE